MPEIDLLDDQRYVGACRPRADEHVLEEVGEPVGGPVDRLGREATILLPHHEVGVKQLLDVSFQRRERGAQFMRSRRDELSLHPVQVGPLAG